MKAPRFFFFFFLSLLLQAGRGMEWWKRCMKNKRNEEKSDLLGIHLSLWINKGNLGWFLPVGLLADRRGERSDTAELRGAGITSKHTLQITAPVWESLIQILVCPTRNPMWCSTSPHKNVTWSKRECILPCLFLDFHMFRYATDTHVWSVIYVLWLPFSFLAQIFCNFAQFFPEKNSWLSPLSQER